MSKFPVFLEKLYVPIPFKSVFKIIFKLIRNLFANNNFINIFFRRLEVSLYPFDTLNKFDQIPEIDILILAAPKDIVLLKYVILGGVHSSVNNIRTIHVITPNRSVLDLELNFGTPTKIITYEDNEILDKKLLDFIENKCGARSGWVKQQLIANHFISNVADIPILNIDSDTILLKKRVWLDSKFTQVFTPTWEFNLGYYKFLNRLNPKVYSCVDLSFVPHHMLFIPDTLKFINRLNNLDHDNLFSIINMQLIEGDVNSFDFKYDYYAQAFIYLKLSHRLEKWSNLSLSRDLLVDLTEKIKTQDDFKYFASTMKYASLSGHDWNN